MSDKQEGKLIDKSAKALVLRPAYRLRKEPAKKGKGSYRRRKKHESTSE